MRKDALLISFYAGMLTMIIFVLICLLIIPADDKHSFSRDDALMHLFANFFTFKFLFMLIFILIATAIDIKILRKYKVNYLFIFELDPNYKVTHI